jgi:ABC-2 type transport system permease protein
MQTLKNIAHLGFKEIRSLYRDPAMLVLIAFAFSFDIYIAAKGQPETLQSAPVAIVDEDRTPLSMRIGDSLYPPYFMTPVITTEAAAAAGMDRGTYSFTLGIPPNFQRDAMAGRQPDLQLNVDATLVSEAFIGSVYMQSILDGDVSEFRQGYRASAPLPVELAPRMLYNPNLIQAWYASVMELINNVTMLSIILSGAALVREREHGTIEHLLVMPVTPFQIVASKVWSMGLVVIVAAVFALEVVVRGFIGVNITGSVLLFLCGLAITLFATTSMGILMGTVSRSMPQFGLLVILVLLPLAVLSGSLTPQASMPVVVQKIMLLAPTSHFVTMAQAILYRGAGLSVVWPQFVAIFAIGAFFFAAALMSFRRSIGTVQP